MIAIFSQHPWPLDQTSARRLEPSVYLLAVMRTLAAAQQTPPHVLSLRPHPEAVEIAVAAVEQVGRSYISTGYLGVKLIELWLAETILSQKNCLIPILPLLPPDVSKPQKYSEPWPSLFRT